MVPPVPVTAFILLVISLLLTPYSLVPSRRNRIVLPSRTRAL